MGRKKKETDSGLLTPLELQIMSALWSIGEGSVHDVLGALPKGKEYAYNTISTILRVLQFKDIVEARKDGRGHIYVPQLSKEDYEALAVSHMVQSVFEGEPKLLVKRLLDENSFSNGDLDEIKRLLEERGRGK